jgi:methylthioribose-1-phosphate isomerase
MKVENVHYRTIWLSGDGWSVEIIDQTQFPHKFVIAGLRTLADAVHAIKSMMVRGAPLIGATAAYGVGLHMRDDPSAEGVRHACELLLRTRPTAVNLKWALSRMQNVLEPVAPPDRVQAAYAEAAKICDEDVAINQAIGRHGFDLIHRVAQRKRTGEAVNILTHCNAGWLATVDWGTATAPVYMAHDRGIPVHVWVDETRPRNQGSALTAWELSNHGVPNTIIVDNAGGHLMQKGLIDLCIVGTDRTTAKGDVCNKIGTYLKALAAHDNDVPFYVALPSPTIDFSITDGLKDIPIEQRAAEEVTRMTGRTEDGRIETVDIMPAGARVDNYAFDVTPAKYISGLITERGIFDATQEALAAAFPERVLMFAA